ncbi:hypothetical protein M0R45_023799 [Rubus argutus]|uniref:Mitochondrial import inner membrane translocase subunit n=1 Tax=Rubus argutus TaxID=59490 RepID=A0AAW1WSG6_RUBAR
MPWTVSANIIRITTSENTWVEVGWLCRWRLCRFFRLDADFLRCRLPPWKSTFSSNEIPVQEQQRAMVNEMVGKLTSACWDKCITSTPGSKFSSSESACLSNCARRYLDMSMIIMKRFQNMQ